MEIKVPADSWLCSLQALGGGPFLAAFQLLVAAGILWPVVTSFLSLPLPSLHAAFLFLSSVSLSSGCLF